VRSDVYRDVFILQAHLINIPSNAADEVARLRERYDRVLTLKHRYRCIALENAIRAGQLPDDLDVSAGACYISAMITGLVTNYLSTPNDDTLESRAAQFADVVILGLKQGLKS